MRMVVAFTISRFFGCFKHKKVVFNMSQKIISKKVDVNEVVRYPRLLNMLVRYMCQYVGCF